MSTEKLPPLAPTKPSPIPHLQLANARFPQMPNPQGDNQIVLEQNPPNRQAQLDEIINQTNATTTASISLLSRGLQLLSIAQLRQLLREYSLPTGGNKRQLVQRLILFLETFAPTQPNLLGQFSNNLKKLLSIEPDIGQTPAQQTESRFPPDISDLINKKSPSILFEEVDKPPYFGPQIVEEQLPSAVFQILPIQQNSPTTDLTNMIPIVQIVPTKNEESKLTKVVLQINGNSIPLQAPYFWYIVPECFSNQVSIRVMELEPTIPVALCVKIVKKAHTSSIINKIMAFDPPQEIKPTGEMKAICPLTRKIIATPARGCNCQHPDCFDLSGFIAFGIKFNSWQCPFCHKVLYPDDIRVDPNFFGLL